LLLHNAPFDPVAAVRLGSEAACQPLVGPLWDHPPGIKDRLSPEPPDLPESASFLEIDPPTVHLAGMKPTHKKGEILLTLQELSGAPTEFCIRFPFNKSIRAVFRTSGTPAGGWLPLAVKDGVIIGNINARSLQVIKVSLV
jgi:hypothetical protein